MTTKNIGGKHTKTYSKNLLSKTIGGFNEASYNPCQFISRYETAIKNAKKLDINPRNRWPDYLATSVYKLAQKISK